MENSNRRNLLVFGGLMIALVLFVGVLFLLAVLSRKPQLPLQPPVTLEMRAPTVEERKQEIWDILSSNDQNSLTKEEKERKQTEIQQALTSFKPKLSPKETKRRQEEIRKALQTNTFQEDARVP